MKTIFLLCIILPSFAFAFEEMIDEIRVYKSSHLMEVYNRGKFIKAYTVMLGRGGLSKKNQENDNLVPEGIYNLDEKNPNSKYFKSIHISYPNEEDIQRAKEQGVEPGGDVFIHGLPNTRSKKIEWLREKLIKVKDHTKFKLLQKQLDWTRGCIAVSDKEILEIYNNINLPSKIIIYH